ncbi:MAG TPA: LysM peptidoglycan-binding domain-containing protein, partial [Caldilineales bacterium]|nr:LysM peptidoglycan-binding domain-containing protein [Caldilineales bacterium]
MASWRLDSGVCTQGYFTTLILLCIMWKSFPSTFLRALQVFVMKTQIARFLLSIFVTMLGVLILPGVTHAEESSGPIIHQVQRGETLTEIAARYGVSVEQLIAHNNLREGNRLYANQRLMIRPTTANEAKTTIYVVKRGETLIRIARRFGTSVAAIQQDNNLRGTIIYVGQRLKIPTKSSNDANKKP